MVENVKPEVIKRTQDLLVPYFKKPPLTEKLLKKPPFRFLHDIILSIIRETGFLNGLYSNEELNPDNMNDRNAKIKFLNKLIYVVESTTGNRLSIKSNKIIAGLEPTKTNELLQLIGIALQNQLSSKEAIKMYNLLTSTKDKQLKLLSKNYSKQTMQKTTTDQKNYKSKKEHVEVFHKNIDKKLHNQLINDVFDEQENIIFSKSKLILDNNTTHINSIPVIQLEKEISRCNLTNNLEILTNSLINSKKKNEYKEIESINSEKNIKYETIDEFNTSIINSERRNINSNFCEDSKINQTIIYDKIFSSSSHLSKTRPNSARPAAPKLQAKMDTLLSKHELYNIINNQNVDGRNNLNLDNSLESYPTLNKKNKLQKLYGKDMYNLDEEHGHLVAQILETHKDLTNSIDFNVTSPVITKNDWNIKIERVKLKSGNKNIGYNIQQLTSASNPLGKLIDLIHENIEIMQKEYLFWINQNINSRKYFIIKKKKAEEFLEGIKMLLIENNIHIKEELKKIQLLKIDISKNDDKMKKLINE